MKKIMVWEERRHNEYHKVGFRVLRDRFVRVAGTTREVVHVSGIGWVLEDSIGGVY